MVSRVDWLAMRLCEAAQFGFISPHRKMIFACQKLLSLRSVHRRFKQMKQTESISHNER
jgi:hypothetical protein